MNHTIMTIAKEIGVSKSTISRVVNDKYDVSEKTKRKVWEAFKRLNYHPNKLAQSFATRKSHSIGIAFYDLSYFAKPGFSDIVTGVLEKTRDHDYCVKLCAAVEKGKLHEEGYFTDLFHGKRVDGLVVFDATIPDVVIRKMKEQHCPVILIDRTLPDTAVPEVLVDNVGGICRITEYLIELGHRRIGFIAGVARYTNVAEKIDGYKLAFETHGLEFDPQLLGRRHLDKGADVVRVTKELLDLPSRPTAIIIGNDEHVPMVFETVKEYGLSIPDDISIAGYSDSPAASSVRPALTTMKIPYSDLGKRATDLLLRIIDGDETDDPQIRLKPELVVRESCLAIGLQKIRVAEGLPGNRENQTFNPHSNYRDSAAESTVVVQQIGKE